MDGPYREGKSLDGLIAPDRRRAKTIALVVSGMVFGALLFQLARSAIVSDPALPPEPTATPIDTAPAPETTRLLTAEDIEGVVAAHRSAIRHTCWDTGRPGQAQANVTVTAVISARGQVVSSTASGSNLAVSKCVEDQVRTWPFPAHGERSRTVSIPFVFRQQVE